MNNRILEIAEEIAREAHKGEKRWDGKPYITHPEAIAKKFVDNELKAVAWLHDVIENTNFTLKDLSDKGIPKRLLDAITCISRRKTEPYLDYILQVKKNELARKVKIEDLKHNLLTIQKGSMKDKYELALYILTDIPNGKNEKE